MLAGKTIYEVSKTRARDCRDGWPVARCTTIGRVRRIALSAWLQNGRIGETRMPSVSVSCPGRHDSSDRQWTLVSLSSCGSENTNEW
jgi:hypothetical protein